MIPWQQAWQDALYGESGFYRQAAGPVAHFATSCHPPLGAVFAEAIVALARASTVTTVVDIGCGRAELLRAIHGIDPTLSLLGVDVVERPADLPAPIGWLVSPGGAGLPAELQGLRDVLVIANEWLDVVPCTILEVAPDGSPHVVLVDPLTGAEALAPGPPDETDLAWCARHWPLTDRQPGDRIEVGLARDLVWSDLRERIVSGVLLAIDYGHTRDRRPSHGTLCGYAAGTPVAPVPDGSCDVTAHVAVDSLPGAHVRSQRDALRSLGFVGTHPPSALAATDPFGYLAALDRAALIRQLTDPHGLGGFAWANVRHTAD